MRHRLQISLLLLFVILGALTSAFTQITPSQDSYTNTATATTNYGAAATLGVVSSAASIQTTYIQFDLSSVPSGYTSANVAKATLKLYVNSVAKAGSFNIDLVNGSWSEKTITAGLSPALGTTIASSVPLTVANTNDYILVDVTSAVGEWLNGSQANDGIALVPNSPLSATIDSKENSSQSHPAELDIVFTSGGTLTGATTASGSGLTGGGSSGTLNLSLRKNCSSNQILQWNGSAWVCAYVGTGTVTSVGLSAPSSDFTVSGSPINGMGTLGLNWNVAPTSANNGNAIVKRDANGDFATQGVYAVNINATNVNTTYVSANGSVGGSQLISTASTGTAPLVVSSTTQVANLNSSLLGGWASSSYALLGASNTFTANQTVNGNLTLGGSINNALTLQGNVTDSNGEQGANMIGGFGGSGSGPGNSVSNGVLGATIAGGGGVFFNGSSLVPVPNSITGSWGTIGGGYLNVAGDVAATVAGGEGNTAGSGLAATVAGGISNTATGLAFVGGGEGNNATYQHATVGGGFGNIASAESSTVPGGNSNTASGYASFAAGSEAVASNEGAFVWADDACCGVVNDTGVRTFTARASGGFTFYTSPNLSTGATLPAGSGSWSMLSDRNAKANFSTVDGQELLARLASLPVSTWKYKAQPDSVRHIGPMAQDFYAAFGLGEDEKHISTVDAQGVALAAIQALYQTVTEQKQQIVELRSRLAQLEHRQ